MMSELEFLEENRNVVKRCYQYRGTYMNTPRFQILRDFIDGSTDAVSLGCGAYDPIVLGVDTAVDIVSESEVYLRKLGYKGAFFLGDVRHLNFKDTQFECAVCSEVLEHLQTEEDIDKAISEIIRVASRWIITVPYNPRGQKNTEITHKHDFDVQKILKLFAPIEVYIAHDDIYFYVSSEPLKPKTEAPLIHDYPEGV